MAQKRKKTAKKTRQTAKQKQNKHIASLILFFFAVLSFFFFIIKGDAFWTSLHNFWHGLFGNLFGLPVTVALGYFAVMCAKEYNTRYIVNRVIAIVVGLVLLSGTMDIFFVAKDQAFAKHIAEMYSLQWWGGGAFGSLIGWPIASLLGKTGGAILLVVLSLVYILIVTRTSLPAFLSLVSAPAKKLKQYADQKAEEEPEQEEFDIENTTFAANLDVPVAGEKKEVDLLTREEASKNSNRVVTAYLDRDIDVEIAEEKKPRHTKQTARANADVISSLNSDDEVEVISADMPASRSEQIVETPKAVIPEYKFPPINLLKKAPKQSTADIKQELKANADKLVDTLRSFGVETRIIDVSRGPSVTRYELQPAAGVRVSKIANLADDIALNLATESARIEAPIPGKPAVGIEVPNRVRSSVSFRELIESDQFKDAKSNITCVLGKDITGAITCMDISKMPHILIAGTTGSGKSVCMNSIIMSILYKARPDQVKMIMIDPKAVELTNYNSIPHLLVPVVTEPRKAAGTLGWAVSEMLERYKKLQASGAKNIDSYNAMAEKNNGFERMPHIVIFIDELADLMMAAKTDVENSICRLAQMARAAGMHLVIATQRPSVDVITGLIKANIPSRIALTTSNQTDSRTILDSNGAEKLIGRGDMLYSPVGVTKPLRVQGCWVSDEEIASVVDFLARKSATDYDANVMHEIERQAENVKGKGSSNEMQSEGGSEDSDPMLDEAIEAVITAGQASTSLLQRKLRLGYSRAARVMDQLEEKGIIGPFNGAKPREVLITQQQWLEMKAMSE